MLSSPDLSLRQLQLIQLLQNYILIYYPNRDAILGFQTTFKQQSEKVQWLT